jgi:hypothetical protein
MKTKMINLYAGSGAGKSTGACEIFAYMKRQGYDVELVREWVKGWAWEERRIEPLDQIYILGKQIKAEKSLYGKVEYIVTDSPLLLGGFYDNLYSGKDNFSKYLVAVKEQVEEITKPYDIFIQRTKPFNPKGRYETEEQAKMNDELLKTYLKNYFNKSLITVKDSSEFAKEVVNIVTLYTGGLSV